MERVSSLFKYTSINERSLENLRHNQLYAQSPDFFNDPYEFIFRFDVTDDQLLDFIKLIYGEGHKIFIERGTSKREILMYARDFYFSEHRKAIGAACFSEEVTNELLWAHYADNHKGMCIEFDKKMYPFKESLKVEYVKDVPVITLRDLTGTEESISNVITQLFISKPEIWSYEKEWRLLTDANSHIPYSKASIISITFGFFCPSDLKESVMKSTSHMNLSYSEIVRAKDFYTIERRPIK